MRIKVSTKQKAINIRIKYNKCDIILILLTPMNHTLFIVEKIYDLPIFIDWSYNWQRSLFLLGTINFIIVTNLLFACTHISPTF